MAYLSGYDVSKYQTASDWTPSGRSFLIARASIGTTPDPQYSNHITKAKAAGLLTGAYHFNWDTDYSGTASPEEQARFFVKTAGDVDFLFLDVEGKMAFEDAESTRFIAEVHRLGKKCGLYMSASVFRNDGQDYDWVARWGDTPPAQKWEFWQYTSAAPATDGGRLDCNRFNGTLDQLKALSNRKEAQVPLIVDPNKTTPATVVIPAETMVYRTDGTAMKAVPSATTKVSPLGVLIGTAHYRVIDAVENSQRVLALVRSSQITQTPIPQITQAQVDAAVKAQADADAAKIAEARAALATAAQAERDRLANIEAERIRAL